MLDLHHGAKQTLLLTKSLLILNKSMYMYEGHNVTLVCKLFSHSVLVLEFLFFSSCFSLLQ